MITKEQVKKEKELIDFTIHTVVGILTDNVRTIEYYFGTCDPDYENMRDGFKELIQKILSTET